jgi:hypothetical protein
MSFRAAVALLVDGLPAGRQILADGGDERCSEEAEAQDPGRGGMEHFSSP